MNIPNHVAIIPDGNRRWAKKQDKPGYFGHQKGAEAFKKIVREALNLEIPYLTFWGASTSNIKKRNKKEVDFLFNIFKKYFKELSESKEIHENKARIRVLGEWRKLLPEDTQKSIKKAIEATREYEGKFNLTFLIAYSGLEEMEQAIRNIVEKNKKEKFEINRELIKNNLYTKELPTVDLVIRTGGEPHLSAGFMMWDIADAQFKFTDTYFPAFSKKEFREMIENYSKTERRFGE